MKLTQKNGIYIYEPVATYAPELLEDMERRAELTLEQIRQMREELAQKPIEVAPQQGGRLRVIKGGKDA